LNVYWLLVGTLGTWRLTHLITAEDGPWQVVARLRRRAGSGFWGGLMDCFNCTSLWMAAPVALLLGDTWVHGGLLWLACSAGAILLERVTTPARGEAPSYVEHADSSGDGDAVLREGQSSSERNGGRPDAGS
jgi:hypothetical protein